MEEQQQLTPWRKSTRSANGGDSCVEVALWRKSTRSGNDGDTCVEVATWRKSTHSGNGGNTCVEVAPMDRVIAVRDSKDPDGPRLGFSPAVWGSFTDLVRHGGLSPTRS
jgi:hypothetical protein